jgi:hypothetical protein
MSHPKQRPLPDPLFSGTYAEAVTAPATFGTRPRQIYVGGAGDLVVKFKSENGETADVTFVGVSGPLNISPTSISSATATDIVAIW